MPKASFYRTFAPIFVMVVLAVVVTVACAQLNSGEFGDPDTGITVSWKVDDGGKGLVGEVFDLLDLDGSTTASLATINLDARTSVPGRILVENLDVPSRIFSLGFPGYPGMVRWFGLIFRGRMVLPSTGDYTFRLISDDGSQLYLDNSTTPIIDHGLQHGATAMDSVRTSFSAGSRNIRIYYFQGPPQRLALQFHVMGPGETTFQAVPAAWLDRPLAL